MDTETFYRILLVQMSYAVKKLRDMEYTSATIVLPGRFHPRNLKKNIQQEHGEKEFVRTLMECFVPQNAWDTHWMIPRPQIKDVCFIHFGEHERPVDHFFKSAVGTGLDMGAAVSEARSLIMMPPSEKTPLLLAGRILGKSIEAKSPSSPEWHAVHGHTFGKQVKASIIYGAEGLKQAKFGLISFVGKGSQDHPCLLKLHYKPNATSVKKAKRISLIGKGVILDTGGQSLKTDGSMECMHFDMAGAATVAAVFRLAVERHLAVELIALLPLVENAIGSKAGRIWDIVRAYDGQTVQIRDTDAEGRLILADATAYSELHVKPDVTVCVGTLSDGSDHSADFVKAIVNSDDLERKAKLAEEYSHERLHLCPRLEKYQHANTLFTGFDSDLINDRGFFYHAGAVFITRFLQWEVSPWMYVDVSTVFDADADDYGAGPGFGVRFLWHVVKQFARN
jgi:leucyl aminopeptidase